MIDADTIETHETGLMPDAAIHQLQDFRRSVRERLGLAWDASDETILTVLHDALTRAEREP